MKAWTLYEKKRCLLSSIYIYIYIFFLFLKFLYLIQIITIFIKVCYQTKKLFIFFFWKLYTIDRRFKTVPSRTLLLQSCDTSLYAHIQYILSCRVRMCTIIYARIKQYISKKDEISKRKKKLKKNSDHKYKEREREKERILWKESDSDNERTHVESFRKFYNR